MAVTDEIKTDEIGSVFKFIFLTYISELVKFLMLYFSVIVMQVLSKITKNHCLKKC